VDFDSIPDEGASVQVRPQLYRQVSSVLRQGEKPHVTQVLDGMLLM
jgi:hypothetical protein